VNGVTNEYILGWNETVENQHNAGREHEANTQQLTELKYWDNEGKIEKALKDQKQR